MLPYFFPPLDEVLLIKLEQRRCSLQTPRDGRNTPVCLGWMFWEGLHHRLRSINNSNASTAARMPPKCKRHINPVTPFLAFHSAVVSLLAKSTQKQSKQ